MRFSVTSPTQNAPFGHVEVASPAQNALFRYVAAREAWDTTPPPACGALWKMAQLGKRARATPRQAAGGVAPGTRRPRPAGPASRKGAVWAEGLAESAPRARPGHHQAASCGLRGCRELSITSLAPRPRAPCPASSGRWALTPGSPPSPRLSSEAPCPAPPTPLVPPSGADVVKTLIETGFRWPHEVNTG